MTTKKTTNKIPTDPEERRAYFQKMGSKGGKNSAASENAVRPFRDVKGLAQKAGSASGYTFKRKTTKTPKQGSVENQNAE